MCLYPHWTAILTADTLLFDDGIELVAGEMDILDWDERPVGATLVEPDESCVFTD